VARARLTERNANSLPEVMRRLFLCVDAIAARLLPCLHVPYRLSAIQFVTRSGFPTMKILTSAEMREVDRLTSEREGIPSATLMENAGGSVAKFIEARFPKYKHRKLAVLCGKGNNGGDGFVVARHLRDLGAAPEVYLLAAPDQMKGDAAENCKRWQASGGLLHIVNTLTEWQNEKSGVLSAEIIVDALLGTGVEGPVRELAGQVIRDLNARERKERSVIVAVDIPSGLPADSGASEGPIVNADYTVTFTAPKAGMFLADANDHLGQLVVANIGSSDGLINQVARGILTWSEAREFEIFARRRKPDSNKGNYGHALVIAGSYGKSGAAIMSSWAALRAGAGLVTVAIPETALLIVAAHNPEIMTEPLPATKEGSISLKSFEHEHFKKLLEGKRVLGMGPGLTTNDETQQFVRQVTKTRTVPSILDADGLNAFAGRAHELKNTAGSLALTPHPGEMSRLLGCTVPEVQAERLALAQKAATDWNAHVVLKGQYTIVAAPDGRAFINSTGNPGMSTAGTGDVLTGMLTGLTAQFGTDDWLRVLAFGVYLHGLAGDIAYRETAEAPLMATDLIRCIPEAYRTFYAECDRV
jgi:ADP-dependent NAD(P)H-hydrate dehydratase / NAD(P)H-hydrate epimerase